jgi:hypothetical protein
MVQSGFADKLVALRDIDGEIVKKVSKDKECILTNARFATSADHTRRGKSVPGNDDDPESIASEDGDVEMQEELNPAGNINHPLGDVMMDEARVEDFE